jgi:hypothetical protein
MTDRQEARGNGVANAKRDRALVTGASSGIGAAIARQLAARGMNLVLVARRRDRLEALAQELRSAHPIDVIVQAQDLCSEGAVSALVEATEAKGLAVDVLINNAGFGAHAAFLDDPWDRSHRMMQLNMSVLTELAYVFGKAMRSRGRGYILNVASIGAYLPVPTMAVYCATKAYVRSFSDALAEELRGSGVFVTTVSPGLTFTEFATTAGQKVPKGAAGMSAEECATIALVALFGARSSVVPGFSNKLMTSVMSLLPRRMAMTAAGKSIEKFSQGSS